MTKVLIDIFGSDHPQQLLEGCGRCTLELPEVTLVLPGQEEVLQAELKHYPHYASRIELMPTSEIITNYDDPIEAVMHKRNSTLVAGMLRLRRDPEVLGMLTAGSTGAALAGSVAFAGRLRGVHTPALATFLPSMHGHPVCLADCGANVDCKPERMVQFALLAVALMQSYGVSNPRVGLLSVGVEECKGSHFIRDVYPLLKQLPINFAGMMEARDALSGDYDVIVSEGFAGNVLLKTVEGTGLFAVQRLLAQADITEEVRAAAQALAAELDFTTHGASMLLGLRKPILKSHGSANAQTVPNAVRQLLRFPMGDFSDCFASLLAQTVPASRGAERQIHSA